jgi:hypothetical protein
VHLEATMASSPNDVSPAASQRIRAAAQELCSAVESRMDELIRLVEEETELVRDGKLFALQELEAEKSRVAKEFVTGLEAVRKIRSSLEHYAPDTIYRLRRHHSEFRSMLQFSLAALETAREASNEMLEAISSGRSIGGDPEPIGDSGEVYAETAEGYVDEAYGEGGYAGQA